MDLNAYAKSCRRVQWFIWAIPLGGRLLQKQSALGFPPLGADTGTYVFIALMLSGLAAILPWKLPIQKVRTGLVLVLFVLFLASAITYFHLGDKYIVSIPIPDQGELSVSVGTVRTPFAIKNFENSTDAEMLIALGPYENQVRKLWTQDSIAGVRLWLFMSYLGLLGSLNFIVGIIAKGDKESDGLGAINAE